MVRVGVLYDPGKGTEEALNFEGNLKPSIDFSAKNHGLLNLYYQVVLRKSSRLDSKMRH